MRNIWKYILILPGLAGLLLFMVIPLTGTIASTFWENGRFTVNGYLEYMQDPYFLNILWVTLRTSLITTLVCSILGFPTAYFISKTQPRVKMLLLLLSIFPLLTSPVVRSFSWMVILGESGLLNNLLTFLGIAGPLDLLYTQSAVTIGLIHLFLPLSIITLVGVMDNISEDVTQAAESLGARRSTIFWQILLPLSIPGLLTGSILVFVGSFTAYTTPALLGGRERVISTFLYQNAMTLNDWQLASIVATIMIVVSFTVIGLMNWAADKIAVKGGKLSG
ncbi:ABC transporter permease [Salibacterium aidingense]|uniref:ABC transporter permease n=1 Tax=Salibacterium aidingense TaxID=384933 RepID=UPI00040C6FF2|nr:ABC transporter permease [Salibacterium aidingense]